MSEETPEGSRWLESVVGHEFTTTSRTVTRDDIHRFADLTGDLDPVHVDEDSAASTRFGGIIAHGLLTLCLAQALSQNAGFVPGIASYGYEDVRFVRPIRPGDTVQATGRVVGLHKTCGPEEAVFQIAYTVSDQNGETVATFVHLELASIEAITTALAARGR